MDSGPSAMLDPLQLFSSQELLERGDRLEAQVQMAIHKIKHLEQLMDKDQSQIKTLTSQLLESNRAQGALSDENTTLRSHLGLAEANLKADSKLRARILQNVKEVNTESKTSAAKLKEELNLMTSNWIGAEGQALQHKRRTIDLEAESKLKQQLLDLEYSLAKMYESASQLSAKRAQTALSSSELAIQNDIVQVTQLVKTNTDLLVQNTVHQVTAENFEQMRSDLEAVYLDKTQKLMARVTSLLDANLGLNKRLGDVVLEEHVIVGFSLTERGDLERAQADKLRLEALLKAKEGESDKSGFGAATDSQSLRHYNRLRRGSSFELQEGLMRTQEPELPGRAGLQSGQGTDLLALHENLLQLHQYNQGMEKEGIVLSKKVKEKEQQIAEFHQELSELLKLESVLGYQSLKEQTKVPAKTLKALEETKAQNQRLQERVRHLEWDQTAKDVLVESLEKEVVLLLFLNQRLCQQLAELDPETAPAKYAREFFRKKKQLKGGDEELYASVEELQMTVSRQQQSLSVAQSEKEALRRQVWQLERQLQGEREAGAAKDKEVERLRGAEMERVGTVADADGPRPTDGEHWDGRLELQRESSRLEGAAAVGDNVRLLEQVHSLVRTNNQLNLNMLKLELAKGSSEAALHKMHVQQKELVSLIKQTMEEKATILSSQQSIQVENEILKTKLSNQDESIKQLLVKLQQHADAYRLMLSAFNKSHELDGIRDLAESKFFTELESWIQQHATLVSEASNYGALLAQAQGRAIKKDFEAQLEMERNQILSFKIQLLAAHSQILEHKNRNLETSIGEFLARVKTLEAERESMETNSALEAVREFMERKKAELEATSQRLESLFEQNQQERRAETEVANNWVESTQSAIQELEAKFASAKDVLEARVVEVQAQAREALQKVRQEGNDHLQERAQEIAQLKQRLERAEFEGNLEIKKDLESLLGANEQLQKELISLETRLALEEINIRAIQEMEKLEQNLQAQKLTPE